MCEENTNVKANN